MRATGGGAPAVDPKRSALGFFAGVRAFFGGVAFVVKTPATWGYAAVPVAVATALFLALSSVAFWAAGALSAHWLGEAEGGWATLGAWALRAFATLVGIVLAFVLALSLTQPFSGFALEKLARAQELALGGREWPEQPFVESAMRSVRVTFAGLAVFVPVIALLALVTLVVPPVAVVTIPLKFVATGMLAGYDLLDYPLGLRGLGVRARFDFMVANFWAVLGFGASAALLLLVPLGALVVLPFAATGAARLVVLRERASEARAASL